MSVVERDSELKQYARETLALVIQLEETLTESLRTIKTRIYALSLAFASDFAAKVAKAKEMMESDDNSDRIPADEFVAWASGVVATSLESPSPEQPKEES